MSKFIIAGIGARFDVPDHVIKVIKAVAFQCAENGWFIRSGGAEGCDRAFEEGAGKNTVVYLPSGYEKWCKDHAPQFGGLGYEIKRNMCPEAWESVKQFHPSHKSLGYGARAHMARNYCQIMGANPDSPRSSAVVCWAKPDLSRLPPHVMGGTGQAVRIAVHYGIPVLNLFGCSEDISAEVDKVMNWLEPASLLQGSAS